ncbi:MAG: type II toxin-antitoxin system VapC family toxin [Dongiaceae bacterium]|jgi:ribonuclease VapC
MVIDTSALLAILLGEKEVRDFNERIEADATRLLSAASYLEAAIIIDDRLGPEGGRDLKLFLVEADIEVVPVTLEQVDVAREAYRSFGRGNHPARLNFGDCFAYALAKVTDEPLLYKGEDFAKTDLAAA